MTKTVVSRRKFIRNAGAALAGAALLPWLESCRTNKNAMQNDGLFFKISLAEWSLHRTLFDGKMTNLDFPIVAKRDFGIEAVEYVNQFFNDKAKDQAYLKDLKMRCDDNGVRSLLIMCDGEGDLGDRDTRKRLQAVENHYKWVEAAHFLGCHSIRVNAFGEGSSEMVASACIDSLTKLCEFAKPHGIKVMVENHGGYSSADGWLTGVMKKVNRPDCGILPDFGNFCVRYEGAHWESPCAEESDRYKLVNDYMPFAFAVSAKAHDFDAEGNCVETDYRRMLKIVKDAGYRGYIGIEYEGSKLPEAEGIKATMALLKKAGA